jgi:glyoxylase-like metal-dependent hydrolase (beta-lactamase superfamily II)
VRIVEIVHSLSTKPVKTIIISQWHGDKPQGLSEILKAWPNARTISTVATQRRLADPVTMNTPGHADLAANDKYQKLLRRYEDRIWEQAAKIDDPDLQLHYAALLFDLRQWARDLDGQLH